MSTKPWIKSLTHITKCHPDTVDGTIYFRVRGTDFTLFVTECCDGSEVTLTDNPSFYFCNKKNITQDKIVSEAIVALSSLRKHLKRQQKQIKKLLSEN